MKLDLRCLQCNVQQMIKIADFLDVSDYQKEQVAKELFTYLKDIDFNKSNPEVMKGTWEIITLGFGVINPYREIKNHYNKILMGMYEEIKSILDMSTSRFDSALRMAAIGNIIDFGPSHTFSQERLFQDLKNIEEKKIFQIDESKKLYEQLTKAQKLLYIGDNCGEIVLDKLFIEEIRNMFPKLEVDFSVRGMPILNDATIEDAEMVGMSEVAKVIHNGDGSPGIVLEHTSPEFRKLFDMADVIIAKGQGNYEGLSGVKRKGLFLILMVKCSLVSENIGVENMKCVCKENYI